MVLQQWLIMLGVTGVALLGILLGLSSNRLKGHWRLTGFAAAMGIILLVVLGRRFPALLPYAPLTWRPLTPIITSRVNSALVAT